MYWIYFVVFAILSGAIFYVMLGAHLRSEANNSDKTAKQILLLTAILVPVISLLVYQQRGASDEVALVESMQAFNQQSDISEAAAIEITEDIQQQLEAITKAKPDRGEYWFLLGSLLVERQDFTGAVAAYGQASSAFPGDIKIQSSLAEAQFIADEYVLTEAVREHIDKVMAADPLDTTVLGILGISAYRAGQFEAAIRFWERSLQALPPMSSAAQSIRASIEQARITGGLTATPDIDGSGDSAAGLFIDLDVSIDVSIQASPETSVFVFARQFGGPPMPVVVERITVSQLPLRLRLDDSKVMIKGRKLADFPQLELVARLSFSGQPMAQKGDYESLVGPVNPSEIDGVIELKIADEVMD